MKDLLAQLHANALPIGLAIVLHGALAALLILGSGFVTAHPQDMPGRGTEHEPIQAVAVKASDFQAAQAQIKQANEAKERHAQALKKQAAEAEAARKKAQQELAETQRKQAAAAKKAEAQAAARKEKLAQLQRQAEAAEKKRAAQEAAAQKAKEQAAQARKEREAEQKRVAEAKAKAKAEAEAKAKAEAAAKAKAARKAKMEAAMKAEAARHRKQVEGSWKAAIRAVVRGNWNQLLTAPKDVDCKVRITQLSNGEVIAAEILACNADAAVQQAIKSAIYKSSPLPLPSDPAVFQRQIVFDFNPGGAS